MEIGNECKLDCVGQGLGYCWPLAVYVHWAVQLTDFVPNSVVYRVES